MILEINNLHTQYQVTQSSKLLFFIDDLSTAMSCKENSWSLISQLYHLYNNICYIEYNNYYYYINMISFS